MSWLGSHELDTRWRTEKRDWANDPWVQENKARESPAQRQQRNDAVMVWLREAAAELGTYEDFARAVMASAKAQGIEL